jgi:putative Holliday junction resolvase
MDALPGRLLGLDVGARRIGVAVSEGRVAVPLTIIQHTRRGDDVAAIVRIVRDERAQAVVVGLPVSVSGEEHGQARLTRRFGEDLARAINVPVVYEDELLSTRDARGATPARTRRGPAHVDDRAAAIILQRYIDARGAAP